MIKKFFEIFCIFIKVDLIESFNKRNIRIIYLFFITFYSIMSKKISEDKKQKLLKNLQIIINEYVKEKNMIEKLRCNEINIDSFNYLYGLYFSLNNFGIAMKYFLNKNNNKLFKQSLIESYNALTHLLKGVNTGQTNLEKNILKTSNHFYRGALDFYKNIIRENILNIDKNKLKEIRLKEFYNIGLDVNNNKEKEEIIKLYKNLISFSIK